MVAKTKPKQRKSREFVELLLQVNNDLAITQTLTQALESLVNITSSIIGAERATIFLNDPKTEELYSRVAQGDFMREMCFMNSKKTFIQNFEF